MVSDVGFFSKSEVLTRNICVAQICHHIFPTYLGTYPDDDRILVHFPRNCAIGVMKSNQFKSGSMEAFAGLRVFSTIRWTNDWFVLAPNSTTPTSWVHELQRSDELYFRQDLIFPQWKPIVEYTVLLRTVKAFAISRSCTNECTQGLNLAVSKRITRSMSLRYEKVGCSFPLMT